MMYVYDLPASLFFLIREYLFLMNTSSVISKYSGPSFKERNQSAQSWRNFLHTNKEYFQEIKRQTVFYHLSRDISKDIFQILSFHNFLSSNKEICSNKLQYLQSLQLSNMSQQIGFTLDHTDLHHFLQNQIHSSSSASASTSGNNHHSINEEEDESVLTDIVIETATEEAEVNNDFTSHSVLPLFHVPSKTVKAKIPFQFETLTLRIARPTQHDPFDDVLLPDPPQLNDHQDEWFTRNVSIHCFPFIKYLHVVDNTFRFNENDVITLQLHPETRLISCILPIKCKIEPSFPCLEYLQVGRFTESQMDFSSLSFHHLHTLDISSNDQIQDVSCFSKVRYLNLSHCLRVKDVSMLGNVYQLNISGCREIVSIHALSHVPILNICGLIHLTDGLSPDNTVLNLSVDDQTWVLAGGPHFIQRNKKLKLVGIRESPAFSLKSRYVPSRRGIGFPVTSLYGYDFGKEFDFESIIQLSLDRCNLPMYFLLTTLRELKRLSISHCEGIQTIAFEYLPELSSLHIDGSPSLKNLTITKPMKQVMLLSNAFVTRLEVKQPVEEISLRQCYRMEFVDIYAKVKELQIMGLRRCKVSDLILR